MTWNRDTLNERVLAGEPGGNWQLSDRETKTSEYLPSLSLALKGGETSLQYIWTPRFEDEDYAAGVLSLTITPVGW